MTKIGVTSEFSSDFRDYVILYALYLQEKLIELCDISFSTSGIILYSHYPFLLHAQNIEVDLYRNLGGFHSDIQWNFPEAYLEGQIIIDNATFYYSQDKIISLGRSGAISLSTPADLTISNIKVFTYNHAQKEPFAQIYYRVEPNWVISDPERKKQFNLTNSYQSIITPGIAASNALVLGTNIQIYATETIRLTNVVHENIRNEWFTIFQYGMKRISKLKR